MRFLILLALGVSAALLIPPTPARAANPSLRFEADGTNGFAFDTGVLRGRLREKGESKGLSPVVYVPTGAKLDSSMGFFGHYRLFTTNKRFGTGAWYWPSEARLQPDGSVFVRWPATNDRPFELRAFYRWAAPSTLDVDTTVLAKALLPGFETFLASYFAPGFTNALAYVSELPGGTTQAGFMPAEQSAGHWQVFPREDTVVSMIRDGRWSYPPNPVDWVVMPRLAKPLGVRRDPVTGLTAVVMSPPKDCFALYMPYQTEPHYSMYLSLFGRDLKPGESVRARTRLLLAPRLSDEKVLAAYRAYCGEMGLGEPGAATAK